MRKWTQKEFFSNTRWYHATQAVSARAIIKNGVKASINCSKPLDFGYGFYLAQDKEWARNYLIEQLKVSEDDASADISDGYILEFEFLPGEYENEYRYKFFEKLDMEFAKFVFRNRERYKYHIFTHCIHNYDMVAGPMSDGKQLEDFLDYKLRRITKGELYERLLQPKEDWQLLLHSQELCDKLILKKAYTVKGEEIDVDTI